MSERRSEVQLDTLIELTHIFNSSLDLKTVLNRVMECAKSVMSAEASCLLLRDKNSNDLLWKSATGEVGKEVLKTVRHPTGTGLAGWVFDHGLPILIEDAYTDPRFDPEMDRRTGFHTRSMVCAPLVVRGEVVGVAEVINRVEDGNPAVFSQEDLEFFRRICDSAAIAVQNALLHDEILKDERRKRDLELAREIQQSFLPDPPRNLDRIGVWMKNRPAQQVGGDFYEFLEIGKDLFFFCIGDVSGKGVPAALYMARLISDIRNIATLEKDPGRVLEGTNKKLCERNLSHMFVTVLAGVIEQDSGRVALASAGHNHPILLSEEGPTLFHVYGQPPLGLLPDSEFSTTETILLPGQGLLLYTDGVTEARDSDQNMWDTAGLLSWLPGRTEKGGALLDALFDSIEEYVQGDTSQDDLTAVLIELG